MLKDFGRMFEWILWNSRYAILSAVIASVVSAFMLIVGGLLDIYPYGRRIIPSLDRHGTV